MSGDDRYSMREECEKVRALEIELQAAENLKRLTARIRDLEAALREAELQRDSWKRIAESGLGLTAETKGDAT